MLRSLALVALLGSLALPRVPLAADPPPPSPARAEPAPRVALEGVRAEIAPPTGEWQSVTDTPVAGQWRVAYARRDAQLEARVYPAEAGMDLRTALLQAADRMGRQLQADGFGVPGLRLFRLEGYDAAECDWWVTVGAETWAGRLRLLRASDQAWALAWGLAAPAAPAAVRAAAQDFCRGLLPSEPAFFEPRPARLDPEEARVTLPGEPPVLRRHLELSADLLEAGGSFRWPGVRRGECVALLEREAREGGPTSREGFREVAAKVSEARGRDAAEQAALHQAIGKRLIDALFARADAGHPPAQALAILLAAGSHRLPPGAQQGLTRFQAEGCVEAAAFVASLAADAPVSPGAEGDVERTTQALAQRATALPAEDRLRLATLGRAGSRLAQRWLELDVVRRHALRTAAVDALLPPVARPVPSPVPTPAPVPAPLNDLRALRARLDAAPRGTDPARQRALLAAALDLPVEVWARLLAPLLVPEDAPPAPAPAPGEPAPGEGGK